MRIICPTASLLLQYAHVENLSTQKEEAGSCPRPDRAQTHAGRQECFASPQGQRPAQAHPLIGLYASEAFASASVGAEGQPGICQAFFPAVYRPLQAQSTAISAFRRHRKRQGGSKFGREASIETADRGAPATADWRLGHHRHRYADCQGSVPKNILAGDRPTFTINKCPQYPNFSTRYCFSR